MAARPARFVSAALVATFVAGAFGVARAVPPPEPPKPGVSSSAVPSPASAPTPGKFLALGSPIDFVLVEAIDSSRDVAGMVIPLRLKSALVVNGVTIAEEGATTTLHIISSRKAAAPDIDATMQISLDPLPIAGGKALPLRLTHEFLSIDRSAGSESTRELTDTAMVTVFMPTALLIMTRKGSDVKIKAGATFQAITAASIDATNPKQIVLSAPHSLILSNDPPHVDLTPPPFYLAHPAPPRPTPTPKPSPTPKPTESPAS